jgi:hypothetical protein
VIVTSGHVTVEAVDPPSGGRFFTKPYRGSEIIHAITEMIQADRRIVAWLAKPKGAVRSQCSSYSEGGEGGR